MVPKRVMMMVGISDGFMVYEEWRWTSRDDMLEARDEGGAAGEERHSVSWVLRKGSISEESSQLSLIFKCRLVPKSFQMDIPED